ncbi:LysR substrate-binding domain-containing protein [uncultured Hydrogenophaga sp.]|uniref:LysR substrate-binding domain-containing protein n=1 Tax=uncultured Hydrogenophaga sp. TaxID=199683 RepID=UPI00258C580A|nr:LysR substrate-binding domain-containing protein [uncultured Hydrogenophaga sp.]
MARLDWFVRANLKFRHLQLLVALDDYRHLGKVAALLNVTPPALSKALGELQEGLGAKVFERTGRGLRPTEYGQALIRHARRMLSELEKAGDELQAISSGLSRRIRVGALPASAAWLLPDALARLKERTPNATVFVREATMDLLINELSLGHLDMIVGTLPSRRDMRSDVEELPLFDDDTVLVCRPDHTLTRQGVVSWADVAHYPWVLPPADSLLRQPLLTAFHAHGVETPANHLETLSLNVTTQYVRITDAIATMPDSLASRLMTEGLLARLPLRLAKLMRPVGAMWIREKLPGAAFSQLIECLRESAADMVARPN